MAAGLTQAQKASATRRWLKLMQAEFGGVYKPARAGCVASLEIAGDVSLYLSWGNFSNGESVATRVAANAVRNVRVEGKYGESAKDMIARLATV